MLLPGELRVRFPGISRDPSSTSPLQPPRRSAGWDPCSPPLSSACPSPWYSGGEEASQALEGRPRELTLQSTRGRVHDRDWGYHPGLCPRTGFRAGGDPPAPRPAVRGTQPKRSRGGDAMAGRRGGDDSPRQGLSRGRSARGASGTAKLSPPPEVRGAEETEREGGREVSPVPLPRTPGVEGGSPEGLGGPERAAPSPRGPHLCAPGPHSPGCRARRPT